MARSASSRDCSTCRTAGSSPAIGSRPTRPIRLVGVDVPLLRRRRRHHVHEFPETHERGRLDVHVLRPPVEQHATQVGLLCRRQEVACQRPCLGLELPMHGEHCGGLVRKALRSGHLDDRAAQRRERHQVERAHDGVVGGRGGIGRHGLGQHPPGEMVALHRIAGPQLDHAHFLDQSHDVVVREPHVLLLQLQQARGRLGVPAGLGRHRAQRLAAREHQCCRQYRDGQCEGARRQRAARRGCLHRRSMVRRGASA